MVSPGQLPHEVLWIAGGIAVLGLLLTWDAYRRWLVTDLLEEKPYGLGKSNIPLKRGPE